MSCIGSATTTRHGSVAVEVITQPSYFGKVLRGGQPLTLHRFVYQIRIINHSDSAFVRLLRRHWRITSGDNEVQEVIGDGVVGEQPLIAPADDYVYQSMVELQTPVGFMQGSYRMQNADDNTHFDAQIGVFTLSVDGARN